MKHLKRTYISPALVAILMGMAPPMALADVMIHIIDAGEGDITLRAVGTLNMAPAPAANSTSNGAATNFTELRADDFFGDINESLSLRSYPTLSSAVGYSLSLGAGVANPSSYYTGPPPFGSFGGSDASSGFTATNFVMGLSPTEAANVTVYGLSGPGSQPTSINLDETLTLTIPDGDKLSPGTWTWGTAGGATGDGITLIISPIPEPSSTALLGFGGLALILRRRR